LHQLGVVEIRQEGRVSRGYEGPQRTAPFPLSRLSAPHELVELAREIEVADSMLQAVVGGKLEVIARQIRALQQEAADTLERARTDARLHRASCGFLKRPGRTYHLYERAPGEAYFSMLSPADWADAPPHPHRGSYRLEVDMSWTPLD
jgi:hypothetical protein